MPIVTYELPDGTTTSLDVDCGSTVMQGSISSNLPGIVAECGGARSCATCHVFVQDEYMHHFAAATDEEQDLLDFTVGVQPNSRLSCQLEVTTAVDGVRVTVPDNSL